MFSFQILNAKLDSNVTIATEEWNYSSITTSNSVNSVYVDVHCEP